ncbi:hypothetical protein PR048_000565 [Dryococelus australis]|uniref:Uncharacterized protein n=1 Tax=Dryococelus australis TaxID=614101 RepID=A0ABQ9IGE8_9NEOP|nr:hypothetical protein PR048_000565 [Dryococelus australis]
MLKGIFARHFSSVKLSVDGQQEEQHFRLYSRHSSSVRASAITRENQFVRMENGATNVNPQTLCAQETPLTSKPPENILGYVRIVELSIHGKILQEHRQKIKYGIRDWAHTSYVRQTGYTHRMYSLTYILEIAYEHTQMSTVVEVSETPSDIKVTGSNPGDQNSCFPLRRTGFDSQWGHPDFHMWESRRTMPLVGRFSRGSPASLALANPALLILTCFTQTPQLI